MQTEDARYPTFCQDAGITQGFGAAGGFLRRLEQEQHVAGQLSQMDGDILRQCQRHGGVAVMAAGVHETGVFRGRGQVCGFRYRQSVHICTEGYRLRFPRVKEGADAADRRCGDGTVQLFQRGADVGDGFRQLPIQFRNPVKITAMVDNRGIHGAPPEGERMYFHANNIAYFLICQQFFWKFPIATIGRTWYDVQK